MGTIISLIISLASVLIIYFIFESKGFKEALIFRILFQLVVNFFDGTLAIMYNSGFLVLIIFLVLLFVLHLISNAIEYWAYNTTSSFLGFLVLGGVIEVIVKFALGFVLNFVLKLIF